MEFREQLERLAAADDLVQIDDRLENPREPFALAAEAARTNGPAVVMENIPGIGTPVSGVHSGPDRMARRERLPWSRCAEALGLDRSVPYPILLEAISSDSERRGDVEEVSLRADVREIDVTALSLPATGNASRPTVTDGILAATVDDVTFWAPLRGAVRGRTRVRVIVPRAFAAAVEGRPVTVALGIPAAATLAAHLQWTGTRRFAASPTAELVANGDPLPVGPTDGGLVPASAEVVLEGEAVTADVPPTGRAAAWESAVPTTTLDVAVGSVATRQDPFLPFVPLGEPLADDVHVTSLVESARLHARVNGYWGVSPVEWVGLPVEGRLGICLVASEILYAGFEWQLANTLFSFSSLFDKVIVLDASASFHELGRALDDMWVKAHPSHDWTFSDPAAPAATAPLYRRDGTTGSRLYVNAAWDPRWDPEYITPEVDFETSYPEEIQEAVFERWTEFGFEVDGGQ